MSYTPTRLLTKGFSDYGEAYELYSDIVSGRDADRKNATIFYEREKLEPYVVQWEPKEP